MAQSNNAPQTKKPKEKKKSRIAAWFREIRSELKKISWPTFRKVLKQTGIVLAVVVFFLVVIFAFDLLLSWLLKLLTTAPVV